MIQSSFHFSLIFNFSKNGFWPAEVINTFFSLHNFLMVQNFTSPLSTHICFYSIDKFLVKFWGPSPISVGGENIWEPKCPRSNHVYYILSGLSYGRTSDSPRIRTCQTQNIHCIISIQSSPYKCPDFPYLLVHAEAAMVCLSSTKRNSRAFPDISYDGITHEHPHHIPINIILPFLRRSVDCCHNNYCTISNSQFAVPSAFVFQVTHFLYTSVQDNVWGNHLVHFLLPRIWEGYQWWNWGKWMMCSGSRCEATMLGRLYQ